MTAAETLRAMAARIRAKGFIPALGNSVDGPRCFIGNADMSAGWPKAREKLRAVIGCDFGSNTLRAAGWTDGCTDDAAAACEIAADLATP